MFGKFSLLPSLLIVKFANVQGGAAQILSVYLDLRYTLPFVKGFGRTKGGTIIGQGTWLFEGYDNMY